MTVRVEKQGEVTTVLLSRPERRNAVDRATAEALSAAFRAFDADPEAKVAVFHGEGGVFCAGADLKAVASGSFNQLTEDGDGPMGPSRLLLGKPVIASIAGHAVAGGLELALWCDLRVAATDARFGVLCRRWGVPLIDGGTVRLPRMIGHAHALDLILTGREVYGDEAARMGLANRLCEPGEALTAAKALAASLSKFPQRCMREDRLSSYEQWSLPLDAAIANEFEHGLRVLEGPEFLAGVRRFFA
jgi:enoyl-CoA hydratase